MSWLARFRAWRAARRMARRVRWLRENNVVYTWPQPDPRSWSEQFMRSARMDRRIR